VQIGEPPIISQAKGAWQLAQKLGATGRFLDAVLHKVLTVSKRVRNETAIWQRRSFYSLCRRPTHS
jgi:glutamyl-tRNA reductase